MNGLSYLEAVVVGALQGFSELFPISSLGHSILLPALIGGSWARDLDVSRPESPYLAFIVGLHVATACALLLFFWRDWVLIVKGFFTSIARRRAVEPYERLAWLIVLATIPVGLAGLLLEHSFRTYLGRPLPAAAFLCLNGLLLFVGERLRRRDSGRAERAGQAAAVPAQTALAEAASAGSNVHNESRMSTQPGGTHHAEAMPAGSADAESDQRVAQLGIGRGVLIGCAQILALLPGISRSGATMVAGQARGLSDIDAARFSFLLATPVIFAAGALKVPDLTGPLGAGIHGPILAGSLASFITAYLSVRFLTKYFEGGTLRPFAWYCLIAGAASFVWLLVR